ncbi:MAG: hypothetical protein JSR66_19100 [Proteobacteria bacterium]|nr:hypothetical protein [Pseudomonadota bacterium]
MHRSRPLAAVATLIALLSVSTLTVCASPAPVSVGLSGSANVSAFFRDGSPVTNGGLDTLGFAYSATLIGNSITWTGTEFKLGAAGSPDAVSGATVTLPAGNYSSLQLLATAVRGNQANQTFVVNYTDGTSTSIVRSLSDWFTPQNYAGESIALKMAYRLGPTGARDSQPFNLYGYTLPLTATKAVKSIVLPQNRKVVVLAMDLNPAGNGGVTVVCNPLSFGAVADGKTDNTTAIQNAINSCASQGGGTVELSPSGSNSYVTGPVTLESHTHLQIDKAVTLQATTNHSRYVPAYLNWVYVPNEALISCKGCTDVGITGAGIIDGAGGQLQANGGPSWWTLAAGENVATNPSVRPYLVEFYQCNQVSVSGVTLRNAPVWTQVFRFSDTITETNTTISAPGNSPNTDGVDLVGATHVVMSGLTIATGDDSIAIKSGLPIEASDPRQAGLPQMATAHVQVSNVTISGGHGLSIGSEASNGVNDVLIQGVHFSFSGNGIRIKTGRDRGSRIFGITYKDITMDHVFVPITVNEYYPAANGPTEPPFQKSQPITASTPFVHDITLQNVTATGAAQQSIIEGLPESCIHNIILNNVNIQTSAAGLVLRHVTGTFTDAVVTPGTGSPYITQENTTIRTVGTTPAIPVMPAQSGQTACAAQVVPN